MHALRRSCCLPGARPARVSLAPEPEMKKEKSRAVSPARNEQPVPRVEQKLGFDAKREETV